MLASLILSHQGCESTGQTIIPGRLVPLQLPLFSTSWKKARFLLNRPCRRRTTHRPATTSLIAAQDAALSSSGQPLASHAPPSLQLSRHTPSALSIEQAVHEYLEDQRNHRRPKTLQWHRKALGLFQHYLRTEHRCVRLDQMTEAQVRGWLEWLPHLPIVTGALRSPGTVASYARSARAFCQWVVRHQCLSVTPFA
ncbi:hypothetical protein [Reticulibacter mediterranei]|uniref:hypothetical protein n=1 Tax=Reticulibacter mediterranei TaxID=2778369 RepID=UPI001C6900F1|nr:hypothetical protein [Reticulibacter mediterranei]